MFCLGAGRELEIPVDPKHGHLANSFPHFLTHTNYLAALTPSSMYFSLCPLAQSGFRLLPNRLSLGFSPAPGCYSAELVSRCLTRPPQALPGVPPGHHDRLPLNDLNRFGPSNVNRCALRSSLLQRARIGFRHASNRFRVMLPAALSDSEPILLRFMTFGL